MKVLAKESPTEFVSFRKLLLNRCQTEFEKDKIDELELEKRQKEIDECDSVSVLLGSGFYWRGY